MPWQWSQPLDEALGSTLLEDRTPDTSTAAAQGDKASAPLSAPHSTDDSHASLETQEENLARLRGEQARIQEQKKRVKLLLQANQEYHQKAPSVFLWCSFRCQTHRPFTTWDFSACQGPKASHVT
jgi:hypothetical protein